MTTTKWVNPSALPLLGAILLAAPAQAETPGPAPEGPKGMAEFQKLMAANPPKRTTPAVEPSIPLSTTGAANSENWEIVFGERTVRNVTQPALYPVKPSAGKANGTAVIIAPGGAFLGLAFDAEGMMVANYLAQRGVTSFVLKYRLDPTPEDPAAFGQVMAQRMGSAKKRMTRGDLIHSKAEALAQADGLAAIAWVRAHAAQYGVKPDHIGMIGFSAGGMTTMNVATAYDAATRPDFIGVIYGAAPKRPVPKDAPPAFIALAADDGLLGHASVPIFEDWRAAGKSVELHIYAAGEHGFGMRKTGTSSENWIGHFAQWLQAMHLTP